MTTTRLNEPTNGGKVCVEYELPYVALARLLGSSDILFHAWNVEAIRAKSAAPKGSRAKKQDDIATYVYRDDGGYICLPGEYVRMSVIKAAKYRPDPRSPRKSAEDLFKAGVVNLTPLARIGPKPTKTWDYEDARRVGVQRAGITRVRPAFKIGWTAEVHLQVLTPEYIPPIVLHEVLIQAGRLIGVGDFRPTYGRFQVSSFEVLKEA